MKLALNTCGFPELPIQECMALAREIGFPAIYLDGLHLPANTSSAQAREVAQAACAQGVEIAAYDPGVGKFAESPSPSESFQKASAAADLAHTLNCRHLILHSSSRPPLPSQLHRLVQEEARWLRELSDAHKEQQLELCLCFKLHSLMNDPFCALGLLHCIDRLNAQVVFDPAALYAGRIHCSVKALQTVEDRMALFLLHDIRLVDGSASAADVPLGQGILDFRPFLRRLHEIRFRGPLVATLYAGDLGIQPRERANREFLAVQALLGEH